MMDLLPDPNSMFWKIGRLQTFEHWPFKSSDNNCNPEEMAAAGFFVIGDKEESDLVECFICTKQLEGWDPDDDPWDEHLKHQSNCPFIAMNKRDEASWTVNDLFSLFKKYYVKECTRIVDKAKAELKNNSIRMASEIPDIYKGTGKS